ncbi:hypothetical protein [Methylobacterium platani]|uniref:Uncharacterized protein n=2 Tax=Methylobacterium platani TaxID=427683 RepID=A0A179S5F4_9HYPH|nr:hypothetical protein [Methylobacterium platani]KMO17940.1 hypothetical protein SQ03_11265 [Methylobacterium platani JCM 14648]OAS19624.1 hypothetical protein A5481_24755 [Methylobacterium platani]
MIRTAAEELPESHSNGLKLSRNTLHCETIFTVAKITQAKITQAKTTQAKITQAKITQAEITQAKVTQAEITRGARLDRCGHDRYRSTFERTRSKVRQAHKVSFSLRRR